MRLYEFKLHKLTQVHIFQEFVEWQWSRAAGRWLCLWHGEVSRSGGGSQGAPSLSDVLSAVFKLCRHWAPVWTKPAKTTEQKIPCVFVWTDTNAMLKVIQVCRRTSRKSPKTCTAGRLGSLHTTWVVVTHNGDLSRVYPCDPY